MKRGLIISLALVMIMAAFMPSQVLAAKPVPFEANGDVLGITPGIVKPAGDSGRFVVIERDIVGSMGGDMGGDITGDYTFSYKANVEQSTQAGNLHGTLTVGGYVLNMSGKTQPLEYRGEADCPEVGSPVSPCWVFTSTIDGHWNFLVGARGEGNFNSDVFLIIDSTGHVVWIDGGSVTLIGQWQE